MSNYEEAEKRAAESLKTTAVGASTQSAAIIAVGWAILAVATAIREVFGKQDKTEKKS